jgi:hypothetical protein
MAIQLKPDEMLDFLRWMDSPRYDDLKIQMEVLADKLADEIELTIPELTRCGDASSGDGMTLAPFEPTSPDDHIPEVLTVFEVEVQEWEDMQDEHSD